MMVSRTRTALIAVLSAFALAGCGSDTEGNNASGNSANGGKGDSNEEWVSSALGERDDPIARYLRTIANVDENGEFFARYQSIQAGLAEVQGCEPSDASNYIISDALITGNEAFPRLVSTVCSSDPSKNWQVFMSPPDPNGRDLDVHTVEMFAWDANTKKYNFYKTFAINGGADHLEVEVSPGECADCHLGPKGLDTGNMPMLPIMNELTQPWEHWNAEPGFESTEFEIPEDVEDAPEYADLTSGEWKTSASTLEQVIRSGHQQVAEARVRSRRDAAPASVSQTMGLLRPFFCDEQVNYVSEAGTSGQLPIDAIVDRGLTDLIKNLEPVGWGQKWMGTDSVLRMPTPQDGDNIVSMLPVRGNSNRVYERLMVSAARGVETDAAIQARLFDWHTPAMSTLRCNLWRDANLRLQRTPLDVNLDEMRNYELLPVLLEEILQVDGTALVPAEEGVFYMVQDEGVWTDFLAAAEAGTVPDAVCEGDACTCDQGFCKADLTTMVNVIEGYVVDFEARDDIRDTMWNVRQDRVCVAVACYNNQPFIPSKETCGPCPLEASAGSN